MGGFWCYEMETWFFLGALVVFVGGFFLSCMGCESVVLNVNYTCGVDVHLMM